MTTLDDVERGARRHAKSAALRNLGTTACPYPADGTNTQNAARHAWYAEYLLRRPPIGLVDYSGDLTALTMAEPGAEAEEIDLTEAEPQVPNVLLTLQEAMGPDGRRLEKYWTTGPGAARINWDSDGDFGRCETALAKHVDDPKGLCATYHKKATGRWPGKGKGH